MTVRYLDLDDYLAIAVGVTGPAGQDPHRCRQDPPGRLGPSRPAASFAREEFYPDFVDKAAVLIVHLAKNHPLPDRNNRAACASLRFFLAYNNWALDPYPSVDEAESAVLAAAAGAWDEQATADWPRPRLRRVAT